MIFIIYNYSAGVGAGVSVAGAGVSVAGAGVSVAGAGAGVSIAGTFVIGVSVAGAGAGVSVDIKGTEQEVTLKANIVNQAINNFLDI